MKQKMKRILSVALVLCLAIGVFCSTTETAQAKAYKKTIKKTFKIKHGKTKLLKFKAKSKATITITVKVKGNPKEYRYVTMNFAGAGYIYDIMQMTAGGIVSKKIKIKKGMQECTINSESSKTLTCTIEIKAKKPVLQYKSLKNTKIEHCSSSLHDH